MLTPIALTYIAHSLNASSLPSVQMMWRESAVDRSMFCMIGAVLIVGNCGAALAFSAATKSSKTLADSLKATVIFSFCASEAMSDLPVSSCRQNIG